MTTDDGQYRLFHCPSRCYTTSAIFCYSHRKLNIYVPKMLESKLVILASICMTTLYREANRSCVIGFNHGLPWCVKYMARGPPVTTKPDGEAGGFCGDRRPEGHVFHTSRQAMIKTYHSTSIRKNMIQNCSYFTQMKSTTTAIDDSNRRRNKLGLGCSREATAPLILIFELRFLWLNIGRYFKGITQFHNCHSPKHTSKNITW